MIEKMLNWWWLWVVLGLLFGTPLGGCSVMSAGPGMMKEIAGGARVIGQTLAAKFDPQEMSAGADGKVSDPRFQMRMTISSGVIVDIEMALVGADLGFDIDAAGTGMASDPELLKTLNEIWSTPGASEEVRKMMVTQAVLDWLAAKAAGPDAEPEPTEP